MKSFVLAVLIIGTVSLGHASKTPTQNVNKELLSSLLKQYKEAVRGAGITANVNEFVEKIFANIATYAVGHGLDPIPLGNVSAKLLAHVDLYDGQLNGISTLERYDDVLVTYESSKKNLTITLPIQFTNIGFNYTYDVKLFGVGPEGSMDGKITNFKFYLSFCLDLSTLEFSIEKLKTSNSGHISVHWHGHITDVILNVLSEFITTILHPFLQGVIEGIIKSVAYKVVDEVNEAIYNITHPSNGTLNNNYNLFNNYVYVH